MEELRARDLGDVLVFGGGVIPDADARALREQGVAEIFGPGSSLKGISRSWLENRRRVGSNQRERDLRGSLRVPGQAVLRPLRHPGQPGRRGRTPSTRRSPQADAAGYPVVVKAQVQVGGRGKAGGIKLADNADEVRLHAGNILGMDIKGHVVKRVWVEQRQRHRRGVLRHLHPRPRRQEAPADAVGRGWRRDRDGRRDRTPTPSSCCTSTRSTGSSLGDGPPGRASTPSSTRARVDGAADILVKLYRCFTEGDCDLAEINPLILRPDGGVHALDAKVSLDDNAAFRHPEWDEFRAHRGARRARADWPARHDLQYIGLDGTVGIIANGAGLAMSTLDVVNQVGGTAANFLDIGGGANADVMAAALEVINFDENVKCIFINIFGGITRGEEVAKGIVEALGRVDLRAPIVIRLDGTNAEEGRQILARRRHPRRQAHVRSPPCSKPPARPSPSRTEGTDMAIFVNENTKVIVQGLTGGQGKYHGLRNQAYGTQVVGGVTPGKGGQDVDGHPGLRHASPTPSPPPAPPHRSSPCRRRPRRRRSSRRPPPASGSSCASPRASRPRTRPRCSTPLRPRPSRTPACSGPNCPGIISPGKCNIGITAGEIAQVPTAAGPNVGIVSRSGTLTYQALYELKQKRHRRVDLRRHRRRPGARHELHRLPRASSRPTPRPTRSS